MTGTRWAVLGSANIAAKSFLPAMRDAGGRAVVVGSRNAERARGWADENQVDRVASYDEAINADDVDAIYIALPNHEHVPWAAKAAATGRAVLCEKPLGVDLPDTEKLLRTLDANALVWEAFVFPFHPQTDLLRSQLAELGEVRQIMSEFTFSPPEESNIRWQPDLGGGALRDVGCYCVRLGRLLFDAEPEHAAARVFRLHGVDADTDGILDFAGERRLVFSASMRRPFSTATRIIGTDGELRVSNPFHPNAGDTVQRWADGRMVEEWAADGKPAFQYGVEHIQAVLAGETEPRHLAGTDAGGNARALDMIIAAAG
ncbi:MAG TPA: Gfo/Idh/MocA family oxidoreductase [Jatrophihabitantaceae bacterium]